MKDKKQKIKIVYEEIEIVEYYIVKSPEYDDFVSRKRFETRNTASSSFARRRLAKVRRLN